ncbi:methyltransferase, FxLD system [Streptomyces sp. NPDC093252]|uniref:methyltransferase, FxLD system n=1 Tax=Streptomyces sp. NPDC093252 TaxID=3154980 RepID=UPI0034422E0B
MRDRVVDGLVASGDIDSDRVAQVMRRVPRHLFAPGASLEEAYSTYSAFVTKRDVSGVAVSSVSAPRIQAFMLEQAGVRRGMRVLEIGSGGLNGAYLAELVGDEGSVTTVDIDPEVTGRAGELLKANGYDRVRVATADAVDGVPDGAPYDVIMVTVGAWDVPPASREQLTGGGRLVVPLWVRGLMRSVGLRREGGRLVSSSVRVCGFVPMRGAGAHASQVVQLSGTEGVTLRFDDGLPVEPGVLPGVLDGPRVEEWSGVMVRRGGGGGHAADVSGDRAARVLHHGRRYRP